MKFDFFTFGGRFFWEDVFNYQDWVIQRRIDTKKYRLLDSFNIRRESGSFENCKNTLLKYIEACEIELPKKDSIILIPNFTRSKKSLNFLAASLNDLDANIIIFNYPSLRKGLRHNADILEQFVNSLTSHGKLHFITNGAGGLVLRKFIAGCNNYRKYNIESVLEINPINSGSPFAEFLAKKHIFQTIFGPMLKDITPRKMQLIPTLPKEISHGIIFSTSLFAYKFRKQLAKLDSFPHLSPPEEHTYANTIKYIYPPSLKPLSDSRLTENCRCFILSNNFEENTDTKDNEKKNI